MASDKERLSRKEILSWLVGVHWDKEKRELLEKGTEASREWRETNSEVPLAHLFLILPHPHLLSTGPLVQLLSYKDVHASIRNETEMVYVCSDHERSELLGRGEEVMEGHQRFWNTEVGIKYSSSGLEWAVLALNLSCSMLTWPLPSCLTFQTFHVLICKMEITVCA